MSKLLRMKLWLPLGEAARTLSKELDETVVIGDVLHLALVGQLTLSVRFVNEVYGLACRPFDNTAEEWMSVPPLTAGAPPISLPEGGVVFAAADGREYLTTNPKIHLDHPVYDLAMIGGEKGDVERAYQRVIGGAEVADSWSNGIFLISQEKYFQLLEYRSTPDVAERWCYFPAGVLPDDSTLVVRPQELDRFIASAKKAISSASVSEVSKGLAPREKTTLLNIIGGLLELMTAHSSVWNNQAAIVQELLENYERCPGIAKSTIDSKFAEAKRSIKQNLPY